MDCKYPNCLQCTAVHCKIAIAIRDSEALKRLIQLQLLQRQEVANDNRRTTSGSI